MGPEPISKIPGSPHADALRQLTLRYEQLVQDLSNLRLLDEVDDPRLGIEEIYRLLLETIGQGLAVENFSLMLFDEKGEFLELRAAGSPFQDKVRTYLPGTWKGKKFALGEGIAGRVAQTGVAIRIDDVTKEPDFTHERGADVQIQSILCYPLRARGITLGVINLSHLEPNYFTSEMENTLALIASRTAGILHSHELYQALGESLENYRLVCQNAGDAILVFDHAHSILSANPAAAEIVGHSCEMIQNHSPHWDEFIEPEDRDQVAAHRARTFQENISDTMEYRIRRSNGSERFLEQCSSPLHDGEGQCIGIVAVIRDLTEKKKGIAEKEALESRLRQSQKLESIGTLAGGIAHDFNNLLTGIMGYASMLRLQADSPEDVLKATTIIEKAAGRAAELTQQLLGFARKGKLQNAPVNLHVSIQEVIELVTRTIDKKIKIVQELRADNPVIQGDPGQLQQVLLNLSLNARDAMPDGGELHFRTKTVIVTPEGGWRHEQVSPGPYIELSVKDNGSGIPPEVLERIFEPFFTTKGVGQGSGMGLAMAYGIVKNHEGHIRTESKEREGTTFQILLPVFEERSSPADLQENESGPVRGRGHILIVDDEELVRAAASEILRSIGYEVTCVTDADEGIEFYGKHGGEIDLVLIDLVMPGKNGIECFERLKEMNPKIQAILSSGFSEDDRVQAALDAGMIGFVQKPFNAQQLSQIIEKGLADRKAK